LNYQQLVQQVAIGTLRNHSSVEPFVATGMANLPIAVPTEAWRKSTQALQACLILMAGC